eukprot:scaffold13160_cov106-Isochrysis_galbana.AAC.4
MPATPRSELMAHCTTPVPPSAQRQSSASEMPGRASSRSACRVSSSRRAAKSAPDPAGSCSKKLSRLITSKPRVNRWMNSGCATNVASWRAGPLEPQMAVLLKRRDASIGGAPAPPVASWFDRVMLMPSRSAEAAPVALRRPSMTGCVRLRLYGSPPTGERSSASHRSRDRKAAAPTSAAAPVPAAPVALPPIAPRHSSNEDRAAVMLTESISGMARLPMRKSRSWSLYVSSR